MDAPEKKASYLEAIRKLTYPVFDEIPGEGFSLRAYLNSVERAFVENALERSDWNRAQAAKLLGVERTCLIEKMRKLGFHLHPASTLGSQRTPRSGKRCRYRSPDGETQST
jgi:DNA-binding NtrC family response regulator